MCVSDCQATYQLQVNMNGIKMDGQSLKTYNYEFPRIRPNIFPERAENQLNF